LVAAGALVVLLAIVGTLQYRWLGAVSDAERDRMRANLRTHATDLAVEFNGELTRIYAAFRADPAGLAADATTMVADAYAQWQTSTPHPALIRAIYLVEGDSEAAPQLFDPRTRALMPTPWPPELRSVLMHGRGGLPSMPGMLLVDSVNTRIPALVIAIPRIARQSVNGQLTVVTDTVGLGRFVVVVLDADRLVNDVVAPLVAKHFGDAASSEYQVSIVRREEPDQVVFKTGASVIDARNADVSVGMFDLRMDELAKLAEGHAAALANAKAAERMAITIVRRGDTGDPKRIVTGNAGEQGGWLLRTRYRSGSLETIVAASRRRNLAVGLGVLGLLVASVLLVIAAAQRQQRLAQQQIEFVAAVSHELRTPLAVICSAGENLADGVVSDPAQIKRYGSLVETEGRRLGAMVERVLDFAGIASGTMLRTRADVDVAQVIAEAVRSLDADARDRDVTIAVHDNGAIPHVVGDGDALRSAVQNVVGNAVKYSARGGTVDVAAEVRDKALRIRVADRGLGIDAADLPHIFKPFYRGRRAVDAEVRGTGVGLSVVRHVVDAHGGAIHVDSRPGEGTTVVVDLPIAS